MGKLSKMSSASSYTSTREKLMRKSGWIVFYHESSIFKSKRRKKDSCENFNVKTGVISIPYFLALVCTVILFTPPAALGDILQSQQANSWMKNDLIKSIRDELTEAEILSIFGSSHHTKVPNFDIISPQIFHRKARGKRSTVSNSPSPVPSPSPSPSLSISQEDLISRSSFEDKSPEKFIQIDGLGRKFNITLRPNLKLLDPDFVHLFRHENRSEILPEHHVKKKLHCFYQGTAYNYLSEGNPATHYETSTSTDDETTNNISPILSGPVALSICGGLQGIILSSDGNSEQEHYVIHPVPDRLHANGKLANKNHHFLWKRDNGHTNVNKQSDGMKGDQFEANPSASAQNSNGYSLGSTCSHDLRNSYSGHNEMNMNDGKLKKSTRHRQRRHSRHRRSPHEFPYLPLSIAPDSYWLQHRSTAAPRSSWKYRSTERATYNQRGEEDDEYDASSSNTDYNWQKGILVYESSSTSSEINPAARALPFYTSSSSFIDNKKREVETRPRNSADWFENPEESTMTYHRSQSNYNTNNYSNTPSTGNGKSNKFYRKGRREDNFFGENWKSSLDSDIMWSEMKEKQSRYDVGNLNTPAPSNKEGGPSTITIETAVFVDRDLYKHMQSNFPEDTQGEVTRIVLAMINAVQLLYQDPSLGHQVDFVLKRLEVLDSDPPGLLRPYDIDRFLTNFCKWQKTENPASDADPLHWDHALILTGLDLYVVHQSGKISNQVVGLAPVAGMCTRSSSCTVNEGRHFESVYVVAHEIGHNLGMRHDGPQAENDCDPTSHIMSPTLGSGKITWSSCSKMYLDKFMETSQSKCLLDRARSETRLDHDADGRLPGERFDADRQCVLKYGRGSYHATQQPLEDVCRDLHCRREHYTWTSHPALEGTYCGLDMWCRAGKCIHKKAAPTASFEQNSNFKDFNGINNHVGGSETAAYSSPKALDGGWGKWSLFTDCSSACLYSNDPALTMGSTGIRLAARRCDSPRPENGGIQCSGPDRRYKTCSTNKICSVGGPRTTIAQYANEVCNRAASVDTELTGRGFMTNTNDPERACSVWCETGDKGGSRSRGWSFPDGTACKMISQSNSGSYYCVAGKCQEFSCSSYTYFGLSDEECTLTSTNEVTPRSWFGGSSTGSNVPSVASSLSSNYRTSKAGWSTWETQSDCKLACLAPAKGLQLVKRHCSTGDSLCSGLAVSVKLCKPDKATIQMNGCNRLQTPFEYATKICSKYADKITGLSGIGMQLSATKDDPDRPCRIGCQDNTVPYRFYMVNGEEGWFPTGTDCSRGDPKKKAYCLGGKCIDFGTDDTPIYRINTKLLGRLEALFQRTKRQAVYNIMEPLHAPSTIDQSSLKDLVHQFSMKTGNYPSINSRSGPDIFPKSEYARHGLVPFPTEEAQLLPYSRSSSNSRFFKLDNAPIFDIFNTSKTRDNYKDDKLHNKGRSLNLHFVEDSDYTSAPDGNSNRFPLTSGTGRGQPIEGSFYEWRKIVSDCSVSCGSGIQEVIVECVSGDTVVNDSLCSGRRRPGHSGYTNCSKPPCESILKPRSSEGSAIWNWLQKLLPPKNSTQKN